MQKMHRLRHVGSTSQHVAAELAPAAYFCDHCITQFISVSLCKVVTMARYTLTTDKVNLAAPIEPYETVLTPNALAFTAHLARLFTPRVQELLAKRAERQKAFDAGVKPDFLPETRAVREGTWKVNPLPADLLDRRVEITGACV